MTKIDLRSWLQAAEQLGEVRRIDVEVDPREEMTGIVYLAGKQRESPVLVFDRPKGTRVDSRWAYNLIGSSLSRFNLTFGLPVDSDPKSTVLACRDKFKKRLAPASVDAADAPVLQNTMVGNEIALNAFAPPQNWPRDGGRYLGTADLVLTRDPDNGTINAGTYRMMVHDDRHLGLYLSPGKGARLHIAKRWERGQDVDVVALFGVHPSWMLIGGKGFPSNLSELDVIGGVTGAPVSITDAVAGDVPLLADAEVAVEGVIRVGDTRPEGPFGEFTGYYGRPEGAAPVVEVRAVHYRNEPILSGAMPAEFPGCDYAFPSALLQSAKIWDDFEQLGVPGIAGVWAYPAAASGRGLIAVSLEQRYAGHVAQVLALAAQMPSSAYFTKWIVAVDEDVDPSDFNDVLWAMSTRCNPQDDIDVLRSTWSTWLDPSQHPPEERPWGSKALINACSSYRYKESLSRRVAMRPETYERIAERWEKELGFSTAIPTVHTDLDINEGAIYHEGRL